MKPVVPAGTLLRVWAEEPHFGKPEIIVSGHLYTDPKAFDDALGDGNYTFSDRVNHVLTARTLRIFRTLSKHSKDLPEAGYFSVRALIQANVEETTTFRGASTSILTGERIVEVLYVKLPSSVLRSPDFLALTDDKVLEKLKVEKNVISELSRGLF